MKKKIIAIVLAALMVFSVFGCGDKTPTVEFKISLDKTTASIVAGDTVKLTPTMTDATATITWKSSDVSKATVDGGVITGVAAGVADITATANGKTAKCVVTVTPKIVTTITLSETTLKLAVGMTEKLTATIDPVATPIWSSSNKAVATVGADGTITAVGAGEAKIIASVGEYKGECSLTVVSPYIKLDNKTKDMYIGKTWLVDYSMLPSGDITWASSDITVATVDGATETVTAIKVGTTTLTATCGDATDSCVITVKPAPTITLSNTNLTLDKSATTYPSSGSTVATVNDGGATTPTINYTSSNDAIATVAANGAITAVGAGNAIITADYNGFTANCDVLVKDYTDYAVIHTPKQFDDIRNNLSKTGKYVLGNNIDMKGATTGSFGGVGGWADGAHTIFDGILDGNGYTVSNFVIGTTGGEGIWYTGIFTRVGSVGKICDISFTEVTTNLGAKSGTVAALNEGIIENVKVSVKYDLVANYNNFTGGLVGWNMGAGKINNCIVSMTPDTPTGNSGASGGLLVGLQNAILTNCFVTAPEGIYNELADEVSKKDRIIGTKDSKGTTTNCAKKTEAELADGALYEAYSKNVWNITTDGVPTLKNQERVAPAIVELYDTDGVFTDNTLQLRAAYNKEGVIHYSSSNPSIASVDQSGVVTALTVGKTIITADIEAITNETIATIDVSVGLVWKTADINAVVAPSYELIPTTASGASITWTSEDEEIAIVDAGMVAAVKSGIVKIVAQIGDVKSKITIDAKKLCLVTSGKQVVFVSETIAAPIQNILERTMTYTSSAPAIVSVTGENMLEAKTAGVAKITCTAAATGAYGADSLVFDLEVISPSLLWEDNCDAAPTKEWATNVSGQGGMTFSYANGIKTLTKSGDNSYSYSAAAVLPSEVSTALNGISKYTIITKIAFADTLEPLDPTGTKYDRSFNIRYRSKTAKADKAGYTQFTVRPFAKSAVDNKSNPIGIAYGDKNGEWTWVDDTRQQKAYKADIATDAYCELKIVVNGTNAKHYIDGEMVLEATLPKYDFPTIAIAVTTIKSANADTKKTTVNMDYFRVYSGLITTPNP